MTPIKDTDYLAVSARLHAMETRLLTPEKQERLLEAASEAEACTGSFPPLCRSLSCWICSGLNTIITISRRS